MKKEERQMLQLAHHIISLDLQRIIDIRNNESFKQIIKEARWAIERDSIENTLLVEEINIVSGILFDGDDTYETQMLLTNVNRKLDKAQAKINMKPIG